VECFAVSVGFENILGKHNIEFSGPAESERQRPNSRRH
jgi:hypothetical protein